MPNEKMRPIYDFEKLVAVPAISDSEWEFLVEQERSAWARFDDLPDDFSDEENDATANAWTPTIYALLKAPVADAAKARIKLEILAAREALSWFDENALLFSHFRADLRRIEGA